jgi:hypothetical protein
MLHFIKDYQLISFHTKPGDVNRCTINADELAEHPDLEGEEIYVFLA